MNGSWYHPCRKPDNPPFLTGAAEDEGGGGPPKRIILPNLNNL